MALQYLAMIFVESQYLLLAIERNSPGFHPDAHLANRTRGCPPTI